MPAESVTRLRSCGHELAKALVEPSPWAELEEALIRRGALLSSLCRGWSHWIRVTRAENRISYGPGTLTYGRIQMRWERT
jgi:hypothetical protein